ncbi:MAG TPA: hypothetical protein VK539_39280 [Myxococcaceae bacterium]|nr:hypothetical protein [Myxococcaceae bacterium]
MFNLFKSLEAKSNEVKPVVKGVVHEGMTLDQVREAMLGLMAQESINQHHMGQLYNHVVKNKLAEAAGYKNAQEWFSKHLVDLSQASLTMYGAVAEAFSEDVGRRFGMSCLSLLLTYEKATDMDADREEPGPTLIEVPGDKGQVLSKPFSQCSVEEMRKALQLKRKPGSSKPMPPGAIERGEQYHLAVKAVFPKVTTVEVQVRNIKGKAVVDFKGIPLEQVNRLTEVLTGELPPLPKVPLLEKLLPQA